MENHARANFIFPCQMMFDIEKNLSMYWEATLNESNKKLPYKNINKNANKNVNILHEWKESRNVDKLLLVSIQGDFKEGYRNENSIRNPIYYEEVEDKITPHNTNKSLKSSRYDIYYVTQGLMHMLK